MWTYYLKNPVTWLIVSISLAAGPAGAQARYVDDAWRALRRPLTELSEDAARLARQGSRAAETLADDAARGAGAAEDLAAGERSLPRKLTSLTPPAGTVSRTKAATRILKNAGPAFAEDAARLAAVFGNDASTLIDRLGPRGVYYLRTSGKTLVPVWQTALREGQDPAFIAALAKYGDRFIRYLDQHKALAAGGVALAAFLANPEPYLDAGQAALHTVTEQVVRPAVETALPKVIEKTVEVTGNLLTRMGERLLAILGREGLLWLILSIALVRWGWPAFLAAMASGWTTLRRVMDRSSTNGEPKAAPGLALATAPVGADPAPLMAARSANPTGQSRMNDFGPGPERAAPAQAFRDGLRPQA